MPRYRLSRDARREVDRIGQYIAQYNPAAALRMYDALQQTFRMLSRQPLLGEAVPEIAANRRCFPVGNYVVYYEPTPGGVRIVRVIHGARDQERALDSPE